MALVIGLIHLYVESFGSQLMKSFWCHKNKQKNAYIFTSRWPLSNILKEQFFFFSSGL